jgi:hypothetical protein
LVGSLSRQLDAKEAALAFDERLRLLTGEARLVALLSGDLRPGEKTTRDLQEVARAMDSDGVAILHR